MTMFDTKFVSQYSTKYYQVPSPTHEILFSRPLARHNILTGAIRTGKSRLASVFFFSYMFMVHKLEPHLQKNYCIIAKSRSALFHNILNNLHEWLPPSIANLFPLSTNSQGTVLKGHKISVRYFSIDDEASVSKIMGSTLHGILIDELTYISKSSYAKVTSRLTGHLKSAFKPFIISTSNPDSVNHWLNTSMIMPYDAGEIAETQVRVIRFQLNPQTCPFLPIETIHSLQEDFRPVPTLYRRNILGEWCSNAASIFPMLDVCTTEYDILVPLCSRFVISIDFGWAVPNGLLLVGLLPDTYFGVTRAVFVRDCQFLATEQTSTIAQYRALRIRELIRGYEDKIVALVYDSANPEQADSLRRVLESAGIYIQFYKSEKNIEESLELLQMALATKKVVFSSGCSATFSCLVSMEYDEKDRKTVVRPYDDHLFDAARYAVMYHELKNKIDWRAYE